MEHASIKIRGIVQGVGFRPFIHKLVKDHALTGIIKNTSSGVSLELEGAKDALTSFVALIPQQAPKLALIEDISVEYTQTLVGYTDFRIIKSQKETRRRTLISPDVSICDDCLKELLDPSDRRYRYPFINCTNCGPRFTIIKDVPYDRGNTSMRGFPMCPSCQTEYGDIENRRYHAQPDCCSDCGPQLFYLDGQGRSVPGDALENARSALKSGKILAVKGLGGMHLACRFEDAPLVWELRRRKQREEKPFALMCRDLDVIRRLCRVSPSEEAILLSHQRPIVLLKKNDIDSLTHISENSYLGVMLPYTPLHVLLLDSDLDALVMTSANLSDCPILYQNQPAVSGLSGIADGFLLHNRDIQSRCDDSLLWVLEGRTYFSRRSRGYVPYPISLPESVIQILACGAEQKASFCLSLGEHAFPSAHIGDLKNLETLCHYEQQISHFQRLFDIQPEALVCDLHPDYLSTQYARERSEKEKLPLLQVQHHHAHLAACLADNGFQDDAIGLIWDGTGYGTDGSIWGGECLIGGYRGFTRFGSLYPIPLIGGDRAGKEISRIAYALSREAGMPCEAWANAAIYEHMLKNALNCPLSSGMGRLFDGVASLLGIRDRAAYEGQGAMLLEAAASTDNEEFYPVVFCGSAPLRYDWRPMIHALMQDRQSGIPLPILAARFHNSLIEMAVRQCMLAREASGLHVVALSGGSFQNQYIMERLPRRLREKGFHVLLHRQVSPNDEGLSLGQIMLAYHALK